MAKTNGTAALIRFILRISAEGEALHKRCLDLQRQLLVERKEVVRLRQDLQDAIATNAARQRKFKERRKVAKEQDTSVTVGNAKVKAAGDNEASSDDKGDGEDAGE